MVIAATPRGDEPRFGLLESMREYAREQLAVAGELDATRHRHATIFVELAERSEQEAIGPDQARWFALLEQEQGNVRAALEWAAEQSNGTDLLRLAAGLWRFWWMCGYLREGERWLEQALFAAESAASLRARALDGYGMIKQGLGDYERARVHLEAALELARAAQDRPTVASALVHLGLGAQLQGDYRRAASLFESGLAVYRAEGHAWGTALALRSLGSARRQLGDLAGAERLLAVANALFRQVGDARARALGLIALASVAGARGDLPRAARLLAEGVSLGRMLGDNARIIAACADVAATLNAARSAPEPIVRLLAASDRLRQRSGVTRGVGEHADQTERLAALRSHLGETEFTRCWTTGAGLSLDQLVELVLAVGTPTARGAHPDPPPASRGRHGTVLSRREHEVLGLVAKGRTTRQIAAELIITERTVKFHVASILQKLGTNTRAQAVAVASRRGLL